METYEFLVWDLTGALAFTLCLSPEDKHCLYTALQDKHCHHDLSPPFSVSEFTRGRDGASAGVCADQAVSSELTMQELADTKVQGLHTLPHS